MTDAVSSRVEQGIPVILDMTSVHHPDSYRLYTDDAPGAEGSRFHEKGSTAYGAAGRGQFKSTVYLRRRPGGDVALTF